MDTPQAEVARYRELDALRGLAAMSVFLSHAFGLTSAPALLAIVRTAGLRAVSDGAAAVDLFFVLSGFVLTKSLAATAIDYRTFLIRRVFRIYPAYWASLIFALIAERLLLDRQALAALSHFGQTAVAGAADWGQLGYHFLMIIPNTFDQDRINPVIWTIIIEMQIALIFPGLLWLFSSSRKLWWSVFLLLISLGLSVLLDKSSPFGFLRFVPLFGYGILLARYREQILAALGRAGTLGIGAFSCACVAAYIIRIYPLPGTGWKHFVAGAGAAGLIVLATRPGAFRRILLSPVLIFYGRISYSVYLFHLPALLVTATIVYARTRSQVAMILASFIVMTVVSWLDFVLIEKPTQEAGRYASSRRESSVLGHHT